MKKERDELIAEVEKLRKSEEEVRTSFEETKSKLKGSSNLRNCMSIRSNSVLETDKKSKQVDDYFRMN